MNGNKILALTVALMGIVLWNMPNTISTSAGEHSYGNASSMCEKCHLDINIELHTGTDAHNNFTCASCHRTESSVTYQSKNTSGKEAHAASMGSCYNCHESFNVTSGTTKTLISGSSTLTIGSSTIILTSGPTATLTAV